MTDVSLDVELHGHHLGRVERRPEGARWMAGPDALERYGIGSTVLSLALPLEATPAPVAATEAFFGGLLPEGARLDALLSDKDRLARSNLVGLLAAVGRDVAGGLVLPGPAITTLGPLLSDAEVAHEVANPRGYLAGGGSAMAGLRPKVALARSTGGWHAARDGHPSTHIVKPASPDALRDARAEVWVMGLAHRAGLTDCDVSLEWFGELPAVVIERFDRVATPDGGLRRLHQEDAAQALGLAWGGDAKFEWHGSGASLRAIAALLDKDRTLRSQGPSDRELLLAQTVFRMVIGDTDGHAKNHTLLHDNEGGVSLSPLYDATPTVLYGQGAVIALEVDGQRLLHTIDADALVAEAGTWGMREREARVVIEHTAEAIRQAARDTPADDTIAQHLPGYVTQSCTALLTGRPVGLGLGEFPTLHRLDVV
jgi:serine/threonine-protein kinase HipA